MKLVFICNQNQCRSPMAEGLARRIVARLGLVVDVRSAGISAFAEGKAVAHAVSVMAEVGVDISGHRSHNLNREDVRWADRLIVTDPRQIEFIRTWFPDAEAKIQPLVEGVLPDPIGGPRERFVACRDLIEKRIQALLENLGGATSPASASGAPP